MPLPPLAARAEDVLGAIDRQFHLGDGRYRLHPGSDEPAHAWDQGVLLSAFVAMTANAPDAARRAVYAGRLRQHVRALERDFWRGEGPVAGFNATAAPAGLDRYYDDNAWIGLALFDAADVLPQDAAAIRRLAFRTTDYVLSGADDTLGGGIWWHEPDKSSKNTCAAAPGAVLALRASGIPGAKSGLDAAARRLRDWLQATLRDPADGLYWDNIKASNRVIEKTKWSYNSALPLHLELDLARESGDKAYLQSARRLADSCLRHWFDPGQGILKDDAAFAHLLAEALLATADATKDPRYRTPVLTSLDALWTHLRRPDGTYPGRWDTAAPEDDRLKKPAQLLAVASAARAYAHAIPAERAAG